MCFSPNILLEPVSVREQSRKFPEHLLKQKHCTLTLHVKAADFATRFFLSADAALLRTGRVAMQRDPAPRNAGKHRNGFASMVVNWDGANVPTRPAREPEKE
jgi:hypothetical protein